MLIFFSLDLSMTSSFPPTNTFSSRFIWMLPAKTNLQVGYQYWCLPHSSSTKNWMYMILFHIHSTCLPPLMPTVRARTIVVHTHWPFTAYDNCSDHSEYAFSVLAGSVISVNPTILILLTCICLRPRCIPCDLVTVTALSWRHRIPYPYVYDVTWSCAAPSDNLDTRYWCTCVWACWSDKH